MVLRMESVLVSMAREYDKAVASMVPEYGEAVSMVLV